MSLKKIAEMLGNLTPAQRAKIISALDRMYREHYSIVQMPDDARVRMSKRLAYVRGEISEDKAAEIFGSSYGEMKDLKEKYVREGLLTADRAVVSHLYNVIRGAVKTTYRDSVARKQEIEAMLYELHVACETILHGEGNRTNFNALPTKEKVFEAVAKSYNGHRKQGRLRPESVATQGAAPEAAVSTTCNKTLTQVLKAVYDSYKQYRDKHESQNEAIEHAIKDNIVGIKHYQLWRGKKGKGEPGTSVDGCKRTLRDNGYNLSYAPAE